MTLRFNFSLIKILNIVGSKIFTKLIENLKILLFIFKMFYFFVNVVNPIFLPSIKDEEQCNLVLSKISIEPISHS